MKLAFTGTRQGMTAKQVVTVTELVVLADPSEARHGVAIGSDAAFHRIVRTNKPAARIIGYPPANPKYRDFTLDCGEWMPEADYGIRDRQLVEASDALIATPKGYKEELRSGTWLTVRHARKVYVPCVIVWPDGTCTVEENDAGLRPLL